MLNAILTGLMEASLGFLVLTLMAGIGIFISEMSNGSMPIMVGSCMFFAMLVSVGVNVILHLNKEKVSLDK